MNNGNMNIAVIYEYSDNEQWSTPHSIIEELRSRGYNVTRYHLSKMTGLEMSAIINNTPDLVLVMDWKGIDILPAFKKHLHNDGVFSVRECADTPQNYDRHLQVCDGYDLLLTPDYTSAQRYRDAGYNCIQWQHFADTRIHHIYPPIYGTGLEPIYARSTRGPGSSYILDSLSEIMPDKFINKNGMLGSEYGIFLSGGFITVQESRHKEVTRRIFEGMACGAMVLTDRLPNSTHIDKLFTEGEDIVYYDGLADCISKINYYVSKEGKLDVYRIAIAGHTKTILFHTQVERVNTLLTQYDIWKTHIK